MTFATGAYIAQSQLVLRSEAAQVPENTLLAYSKDTEFIEYCESVHSGSPISPATHITEEKAFAFLFYQAFRSQRKRGRKRKLLENNATLFGLPPETEEQPRKFDRDDYDKVIKT